MNNSNNNNNENNKLEHRNEVQEEFLYLVEGLMLVSCEALSSIR